MNSDKIRNFFRFDKVRNFFREKFGKKSNAASPE